MRRLYIDNPVLRDLTGNPEFLKNCYDDFVRIFGRSFKGVKSYYLFFEFYGIKKDWFGIPAEMLRWDFSDKRGSPTSVDYIAFIDQKCKEGIQRIDAHIGGRLQSLQNALKEVIARRLGEMTQTGEEIEKVLFGDIRHLINEDYKTFVSVAKGYLVWDAFCGVSPKKLCTSLLRQRQLSHWHHARQDGWVLPVGKIIDDHAKYYDMSFESYFKDYEDMVDAEMITYLMFGHPTDGELERCDCLTYDSSAEISERMRLSLGTISNLKATLNQDVQHKFGKAYCITKENGQICRDGKVSFSHVHDPIIPIELEYQTR
jgi:hypothetical protein